MRRLDSNKLGRKGGMALAEALKSNSVDKSNSVTTLERLSSAALPSNALTHAQLHGSVYFTPFLSP